MTGSALARNHAGTFTPSDAKAARNAVTSRRSRRRSSTTCCPGSSFTISVARSGTTGPSHSSAQHDDRRERVEQPTTDLTVGQIGAHEHHIAAVGAVARCARRGPWCRSGSARRACGSSRPARSRWSARRRDGARRRTVPEPRTITTSPAASSTGSHREPCTSHAAPCVIATTASGASSSIRMDQGGSSTTFIRKAARARGPSRNAASASISRIVDEKRWIRAFQLWEVCANYGLIEP